MKQLTLSEISELISGELTDQESLQVNGVNDLKMRLLRKLLL